MEIITKLQQGILQQKIEDYKLENDEILMYRGRIYVPNSQELKNMILREMHNVPYVGNPVIKKLLQLSRANIIGQE
jgi:hypothetical protein